MIIIKTSFSNLFGSFLILLSLILPLEVLASDWTIWEPATVYYDFEGPAGSTYVKDRRGNNDLTLTAASGEAAYIEAGDLTGNAAFFSRGVQYGVADDSAEFSQTGSFSVESWVKFSNISSVENSIQTVLAKWDETSDDRSYRLIIQTDSTGRAFPKFQISTDGTAANIKTVTGATQIIPQKWYLLQGYYDTGAGAIYIYVNGVQEGSTGSVGSSITDEPSNFYLATTKTGSSTYDHFFSGYIDELRLFSGTRSEGSLAYSMKRGEPVAKIRFNDGSGVQTVDSSSFNNRGALINFPTNNSQWVQGINNYALQFDGTDDYVDLGSKNSLQLGKAMTISVWIYFSSLGNYTIVSQPHANGYTFALTSAGEMTFGALGGTTVTSSGAAISAAEWTHVAVTYDGSTVYFYKDGRVISSHALSLWSVSNGGVFVGRAASTPNYFAGKMDDLFIYPYNRSLFEIFLDVSGGNIRLSKLKSLEPANEELACPKGYVWVPGDPLFGTSDFCVMQYEAKYDKSGDGIGDNASDYGCIADSGDGWDWRDAGCSTGGTVVSSANGSPIVHITHTQAVSVCPTGSHLINNNEWMTIARNAASMASNWADKVIGSTVASGGGLKRGNVGLSDSASYNATTDPDKGARCPTGSEAACKAKLVLSNGQEIWDISGNVWEHVNFDADKDGIYNEANDLVSLKDEPEATNGASTRSGWEWSGFTSDGLTWWLSNNGSGPLNYDVFRPVNSSWNANYGVGRIYHYSDGAATTPTYVFLRGGDWYVGANAGAFTLGLNDAVSDQHGSVGLRCAR